MPEQTDTVTTKSTSYSVSPAPHNDSRYTWVLVVVGAVIVVALAVLLASSTATNNQNNSGQTTTTVTNQTKSNVSSVNTSNASASGTQVREYSISGSSFAFSPSEITASRGDTVRVQFTNTGDHDHDFIVEGIAGAATAVLAPGASQTIEFVIPASGPSSYKVYCGVGEHEEAGMVGTLRIV